MSAARRNPPIDLKWLAKVLLLALVYYASARLGLLLAFGYRNVSPVWPSSGLAVAGLLLLGFRTWPAILLGAFLANYSTGLPFFTAAFISVGNTTEAILGAFILGGIVHMPAPLGRIREVTRLMSAAILASAAAATIGVGSLGLGGIVALREFQPAWITWWLGDAMGIMIAAPLLLTLSSTIREYSRRPRNIPVYSAMEAAAISISLTLVTLIVFSSRTMFSYAVFPLLIWTAVRFGTLGAALAVAGVSAISVAATLGGLGPFHMAEPDRSLMHLQAWMGIVSATTFVLAAAISERRATERENSELARQLKLAMQETHHRVKNNLQIVAAMVDFLLLKDKPQVTPEELRNLGSHVRALAVVHDILTREAKQTGESRSVSAKAILEELIPLIRSSASERRIEFHVDDARLSTRQGTSLALVVNELINNALKHGRGAVEVDFKVCNGTGRLDVRDEGPGFPSGFLPDAVGTTGLSMVTNLVRVDLSGSVTFSRVVDGSPDGAQVTVQIPIPSPDDRLISNA